MIAIVFYCQGQQGLVFVVDGSSHDRLPEAKDAFCSILNDENIAEGIPIVVSFMIIILCRSNCSAPICPGTSGDNTPFRLPMSPYHTFASLLRPIQSV